jgi:hypothetical protein
MHRTRKNRRGLSVVEWTVIGSLMSAAVLWSAGPLGQATNDQRSDRRSSQRRQWHSRPSGSRSERPGRRKRRVYFVRFVRACRHSGFRRHHLRRRDGEHDDVRLIRQREGEVTSWVLEYRSAEECSNGHRPRTS